MSNPAETIIEYLTKNKFSEAIQVLSDTKNEAGVKKYCWDLIPVLFKNISKEMEIENVYLKKCSENLLEIVAKKAEAEEVVLEFLDQLESADSIKFSFVVKLLVISLERCTQNKQRFIELSLVTVRSYLEEYILSPSDFISEEEYEEELYIKLSEITTVLNAAVNFYEIFVSHVFSKSQGYESEEIVNILLSRLIQLYDFFLPCGNGNKMKPLEEVENNVMRLIKLLLNNPYYLLQFLLSKCVRNQNKSMKAKTINYKDEDLRNICDDIDLNDSLESFTVYENDSIIPDLSYAVFFYSVLKSEKEGHEIRVPHVYNPKYKFLSLANLSNSFFEKTCNKTVLKGLIFLETLLDFLNGMHLERYDLFFMFHEKILVNLYTVMVYNQVESTRKLALKCFKKYIEVFDYEARYLLLLNIRPKIEHSGTLGFLITLLKEYILDILNHDGLKSNLKFYSGANLFDLISKYCFLTNGKNTDLVQYADQIISSLNMLRFLLIRDRENKTEIRNYMEIIDDKYLKPLRAGIVSCKEYYQIKLQEFRKEPISSDNNVELTINGQPLAKISVEEQQIAMFASLNAIDLIDSLLLRVLECTNNDVS